MTRNSIIRRVFAFAEIVAVVHSRTETVADPQLGGLPRLNVFVNLYSRDGTPLVSDIRLSDMPVGRDSSHLYVIDYGAPGRRPAAPVSGCSESPSAQLATRGRRMRRPVGRPAGHLQRRTVVMSFPRRYAVEVIWILLLVALFFALPNEVQSQSWRMGLDNAQGCQAEEDDCGF